MLLSRLVVLALLLDVGTSCGWATADSGGNARDGVGRRHERRSEPAARLSLVWFDPLNALPCSAAEVGREVSETFAAAGVTVDWRAGGPDATTQLPELQVILLDGDPSRSRPRAPVLGAALHRDPVAAHALWLMLPNVKRALGIDPTPRRPVSEGQARQVARALGRVVAHEVVHLVAPDLPHAPLGLMRAHLDRATLLGRRAGLDSSSRAALLSGLATLAARDALPWYSAGARTVALRD